MTVTKEIECQHPKCIRDATGICGGPCRTAALSAQPAVAVQDGWKPTQEQTASACLSYRHDFGLLPASDREALMRTAQSWLEAWLKVWPAVPQPAQPADQQENERLRQDNELWRQNSEDTWAAMTAMRNSINEHVPMPSIESDLLQGPDNSVFCAAVAEAVVFYITSTKQRVKALEEALEAQAKQHEMLHAMAGKDRISIVNPNGSLRRVSLRTVIEMECKVAAEAARAALKGGEA